MRPPDPLLSFGRVRKKGKAVTLRTWRFCGFDPHLGHCKNDRVVQRRRRLRDMQENDGSIPSAVTFETIRSVSVAAARVCGMDEDRVQFPDGPLIQMGWHVPRGRLILARSVRRVRFPSGPLNTEGSRIRLAGPVC